MSDSLEDEDSIVPLQRSLVDPQVGKLVTHNNTTYKITEVLDFQSVIAVDVETGRSKALRIKELQPLTNDLLPQGFVEVERLAISDDSWAIAEQRYFAIKPLLNIPYLTKHDVEKRAKEVNQSVPTLYRWMKVFKAYGVVSALVPQKRGWREGNLRISPLLETIIDEAIKSVYLTTQRARVHKTIEEVCRVCSLRGLTAPAGNTIRARIDMIPEKLRLRARGQREVAKKKFTATPGRFPNADAPLMVIQIDHTPLDIILVDDEHRKPIGRPWITLAIDVYSRMVTGYYVSFDPPSEVSVAMCVAHSVCPKEEWLVLHEVNAEWPVWGKPNKIHVDNGGEFRSDNFRQSCLMHDINLEFRPVRQPQYGGHIERLLGTFLFEIHSLPGTTFSSIKDRDEYDSDKHSAMTKSEFEIWLAGHICRVYHQRVHSALGTSPLKQWEIGVFGNKNTVGCGLPPRPANRFAFMLDFMPYEMRTIQTFGVTIDKITYYDDVLRSWINSSDPSDPKKKRKFIFRYDPRDLSQIWFYNPDTEEYNKIPYADLSLPSISSWELRLAKEHLRKEGKASINEVQIFQAITELREMVEESKAKTKRARRLSQRRKEHEKTREQMQNVAEQSPSIKPVAVTAFENNLLDEDVEAYGDIA